MHKMIAFKFILLLSLMCFYELQASSPSWRDSSENVHAFLTFDYLIQPSSINKSNSMYDYVWGAGPSTVQAFAAASPMTILSSYIPYQRDPFGYNLSWWQSTHPDMILYKCDKKTPAYVCYSGEPCPDGPRALVPLDLANVKTLQWQIQTAVSNAKRLGYHAIAWDNFDLENSFGGCGSFSGPNGTWVQRYSGHPVDPNWSEVVLSWAAQVHSALHSLSLLSIPNYQNWLLWDDERNFRIGNSTDGILDEGGFVNWGAGTSWNWTGYLSMTRTSFENRLYFVQNLQRHGKAYYQINEWGPGADYKMNVKEIPYNISGSQNIWIRQFVVGSYLLSKGNASAVYLVCIQCYGNWNWWEPEYSAQVGFASGDAWKNISTGVWCRSFTKGFVCVNPDEAFSGFPNAQVWLPLGSNYSTLYGENFVGGSVIKLGPTQAFILLKV